MVEISWAERGTWIPTKSGWRLGTDGRAVLVHITSVDDSPESEDWTGLTHGHEGYVEGQDVQAGWWASRIPEVNLTTKVGPRNAHVGGGKAKCTTVGNHTGRGSNSSSSNAHTAFTN